MRMAAAILSGVAASVLAALLLVWVAAALTISGMGLGLHIWSARVSLLFGILLAGVTFVAIPVPLNDTTRRPRTFWEWLMIGVFVLAAARAFFWLIYADGDEWKVLSPNNLGDLALHLSFIHWFAATSHWWPASPILVGDLLRYPLGSDLFNSLLLIVGVPVEKGLLWCGLGGAALTGFALWCWGRAFAIAALLFNGGFAGWEFFTSGGGDPDAVCEWKNLFLTLFVTQRGFLFALPAGLLLLTAWRGESVSSRKRATEEKSALGVAIVPMSAKVLLPLPVQALLLGVIPLFSIHTALFLGVAMTGVLIFLPESRRRIALLALLAWPPMAFFGWLVTSGAGGPSAIASLGWSPGWMSDGTLGFWLWNFGITPPLVLLLCVLLIKQKGSPEARQEARAFVWPAVSLFLVCLLVRFAPWPWDNMKLMLWSWLVVAPYLWSLLLERQGLAIRIPLLVLLFASGAASLVVGLDGRHGYELIKRSTIDQAAWALRELPPDAVVACAPEHNHPVLILGHPIVCGYEGHLWSHGLDYKDRLATLNSIMNGEVGWREKAHSLGVRHVYWSDLEAKRWPGSKLPWAREVVPTLHQLE